MDNTIYRLARLLICGVLFSDLAHAWFQQCDNQINLGINEAKTITMPNYCPAQPAVDSSRFLITAPQGFSISINCNINTARSSTGSCTSDYFYISRTNDPSLQGAEYFCGVGNVQRQSKFNYAVIAHTSTQRTATFSCTVKATCECGWSVTSKIVGGWQAGVNQYTPMAGIIDLQGGFPFCGGSIISPTHVLSSAHCFLYPYNSVSRVGVLVGDHDYTTGADTAFSALYNVLSITSHPYYNVNTNANDIAVVKTMTTITYNAGVAPACLPFGYAQTAFDNTVLEVPGWGTLEFGGQRPTKLQTTNLNTMSNSVCTSRGMAGIGAGQICTYTQGSDSCQYDSGGALYYRFNQLFAIGLVSYGQACGSSAPSVNTRIAYYLPWIRSVCAGAYFCYQ